MLPSVRPLARPFVQPFDYTNYVRSFSQRVPLNHLTAYVSDMLRRGKLSEQYEVCTHEGINLQKFPIEHTNLDFFPLMYLVFVGNWSRPTYECIHVE